MSADTLAATLLIAAALAWFALSLARMAAREAAREDADYDAHRTPGMGEPGSPFLFDSPEFRDQVHAYCGSLIAAIDAEFARRAADEAAELDDDAAVAAWLGGGA